MATEPLLTATPSGDLLELRPAGSWTAADVATLERLADAVTPQLDRSNFVRTDMPPAAALAFSDAFGRIAKEIIAWTVQAL